MSETSGVIEIISGYEFEWVRDTHSVLWGNVHAPGHSGCVMGIAPFPGASPAEAAERAEAQLISSGIVHLEDVSDEWIAEHPEVKGYGVR